MELRAAGGRTAVIATEEAPRAIGPYSQGVAVDGLVFTAGQIGLDPADGRLVAGGIEPEARRALANLRAVLESGSASLASVIKTTVFLVDMADFPAMNAVYGEHFSAPFPARSTIAVRALPLGARFEIEAIAGTLG